MNVRQRLVSDWVEEPKTFDSETITPEEMRELQDSFYNSDLVGGLQNVEVPPEEVERQRSQDEHVSSFIELTTDTGIPCYKRDKVTLKLTPEQIHVLLKVLQNASLDMKNVEYLEEDGHSLFEQQIYVHLLHNKVDELMCEYVKHRPYNPFLKSWYQRIGRGEDV